MGLASKALIESTIGLYNTKLIKPRRPWHTLSQVELATAEWVDWYNHRRLHGEIGHVPPVEYETTYYAKDVPDWIHTHLQTALSLGGTCALQLAVNAPDVYGALIDISGQQEPTLGDRAKTVRAAFAGDQAAFDAVDPLYVIAHTKFPDTGAAFAVGTDDQEFGPQQPPVHDAAVRSGMKTTVTTLPGGHDWSVFRPGLFQNIPWLARQQGLIR